MPTRGSSQFLAESKRIGPAGTEQGQSRGGTCGRGMAVNGGDRSKDNGSENAGQAEDPRVTEVSSGGAHGVVMVMMAFRACHLGQGHKGISNNSKLWDSRN